MRYTFSSPSWPRASIFCPSPWGFSVFPKCSSPLKNRREIRNFRRSVSGTLADAGGVEALVLARSSGFLHRPFFHRPHPRPSPVISTMVSYSVESKLDKSGEFGRGAIEGVAGPEAANNASVGAPTFPDGAGDPFTPAMAVVMAVLLIHGISPGPLLMTESPTSSGALSQACTSAISCSSSLICRWWVSLRASSVRLSPSHADRPFAVSGGSLLRQQFAPRHLAHGRLRPVGLSPAASQVRPCPLVLALVLGPMMERSFREAMMISRGDLSIFLTRPISGTILIVGAITLVALCCSHGSNRSSAVNLKP